MFWMNTVRWKVPGASGGTMCCWWWWWWLQVAEQFVPLAPVHGRRLLGRSFLPRSFFGLGQRHAETQPVCWSRLDTHFTCVYLLYRQRIASDLNFAAWMEPPPLRLNVCVCVCCVPVRRAAPWWRRAARRWRRRWTPTSSPTLWPSSLVPPAAQETLNVDIKSQSQNIWSQVTRKLHRLVAMTLERNRTQKLLWNGSTHSTDLHIVFWNISFE